ncbi:MAG: FAD-binding protein [Gordonibacter sp.]|uniref:FAD-dependent oxidoreductase n=2 Tax=Gordonibacter sp. TaxID=1968902 RepID=UPI002FC95D55
MGTASSKKHTKDLSRRNFLKGAAATAAGIASVGLIGCNSAKPQSSKQEAWDTEAEIVIIGLGAAGLAAAIAAKKEGAQSVLCLEVAPEEFAGGNTRVSGDMLMIPDDVSSGVTYQTTLNDSYEVPSEYMQAWAEGVCGNMAWLTEELGYDLQPGTAAAPEFPGLPGSDKIKTYYVDGICGFSSLWLPFMDTAAELGVEIMYETRATELIFDTTTKEVFGVLAGDKRIKASKGVIMACGGFENDPDLLQNYFPGIGCPNPFYNGSPYNVGDGIRMAQKIGADLWHMNSIAASAICGRTLSPDSRSAGFLNLSSKDYIYINNEGERFMCEETKSLARHGKLKDKGIWPLLTVPTPSHVIFGSAAFNEKFLFGSIDYMGWSIIAEPGPATNQALVDAGVLVKADTLAELARKIGHNADAITATVDRYNSMVAQGKDEDFGRGESVYDNYFFSAEKASGTSDVTTYSNTKTEVLKAFPLVPIEGPFYAMEVALGLLNTQGGAKRNGESQVLDTDGSVIPRLYSAGEFGSIYAYMYNGGGNISEAVSTGRIAGIGCAKLDPWDA